MTAISQLLRWFSKRRGKATLFRKSLTEVNAINAQGFQGVVASFFAVTSRRVDLQGLAASHVSELRGKEDLVSFSSFLKPFG